jgi:hypothetical protein
MKRWWLSLVMVCAVLPNYTPAQEMPGAVQGAKREKYSPGYTSYELIVSAWNAFNAKLYDQAVILANQCVQDYAPVASEQQRGLDELPSAEKANDYWALNDVATALYIKGRALEKQGMGSVARGVYGQILKKYPHAQCYDPKDVYWSVAAAARDRLKCMELKIDFGDYKSSTLTAKAWDALKQGQSQAAEAYADKCVELFSDEARRMQGSLRAFPSAGLEWDYWALNDVGTCLYIKGQALAKQGKEDSAGKVYQEILGSFYYAQCWDAQNEWFWKIADAARKLLYKNKEL